MTKKILPALEKFINNLREIWEEFPDDETRMKRAHAVMENGLLKDQELREHCRTWPSTEGRKNLLFYKKDIAVLARAGFNFGTSKKVMDLESDEYSKIINLL